MFAGMSSQPGVCGGLRTEDLHLHEYRSISALFDE
jgi:hypothetical protein